MKQSTWRTRALIAGGVAGAVIGVTAAYVFVRAAERHNPDNKGVDIQPAEAVAIGVAVLTLMRQIAQLPETSAKRRLK